MASRYRVPAVRWHLNDPDGIYAYAKPLLDSLNAGDSAGAGYNRSIDRLDPLHDILPRVPTELQRRLATGYGTIQLTDGTATTGIDQLRRVTSVLVKGPDGRRRAVWQHSTLIQPT